MEGYEGLLRSGRKGGGISGRMGPPPIHVRSDSRTLGLRVARNGGGGGATAARALLSSSDGGHDPPLPLVTVGVRGSRGSASGMPAGSKSRDGCLQPATAAVAEDNFNVNNHNVTEDDEI